MPTETLICCGRAIKELHRQAADRLAADHATRAEVERLLSELQQLLAGISIMQVRSERQHPHAAAMQCRPMPAQILACCIASQDDAEHCS